MSEIKVNMSLSLPDYRIFYSLDPPFYPPLPFMRIWVSGGDIVTFESPHPFAIHFSPLSPFGLLAARGVRKVPDGPYSFSEYVRADVAPGYYKFFVALHSEGHVFTDDPDIIVDPRRH